MAFFRRYIMYRLFFYSFQSLPHPRLLFSRQEATRPFSRSLSDPHGYIACYFDADVNTEGKENEKQEKAHSDEEEVKSPRSPRERTSSK